MIFSPSSFSQSPLRRQVLAWLEANVPPARVAHSLRVEAMAVDLAGCHGLSLDQAAQAGLMHDLAKYFKAERLLAMAEAHHISLDPVDQSYPHLLHADVSAVVAQQEFGLDHPELLAAIANHTLGRPGMSPLSGIVFLADSLEPGRGDSAELNHLRQLSRQDWGHAVYQTCDYTFAHLMAKRQPIHPRAVLTRNWFLAHHKVPLDNPLALAQDRGRTGCRP
ncbi:MAG: HD domain-containing protein [Leptolyngbyaceae cyanobacterium SM2_3_12]|nr:HD domain-containing protein [Leptolyngbyaceae cyanobacterium SM2_3_12]